MAIIANVIRFVHLTLKVCCVLAGFPVRNLLGTKLH